MTVFQEQQNMFVNALCLPPNTLILRRPVPLHQTDVHFTTQAGLKAKFFFPFENSDGFPVRRLCAACILYRAPLRG